jgi:hypothetical protein
MKLLRLLFLVIFLLCSHPADALAVAKRKLPFMPGERLHFVLRWSAIPVGRATLEVMENVKIGEENAFHFVFTARTNKFADLFFKVRDRVDAYTDEKITRSLVYLQKQREGSRKRDIRVLLDHANSVAHYFRPGKNTRTIPIRPGTFDPLSLFYAFRLQEIRENMTLSAPVTDGKKCVTGIAKIIRVETIRVQSREYKAFLVEPDMKDVGGVFEKTKDAKFRVWITADRHRIPVKIESEVIVGRFTAELVAMENVAQKKR